MSSIKLETEEEEIRNYMKRKEKDYQYKEALFIKYLKDNGVTRERLEMLLKKHHQVDKTVYGTYRIGLNARLLDPLPLFNDDLKIIHNLDINGICHILIPTMKYYGKNTTNIGGLYANLDLLSSELMVSMNNPLNVINSTLEDYKMCRNIEIDGVKVNICMSRETCRKELQVYQDYYEESKVKQIRKIMGERLK